jgi:hypothetical protein
MDLYRNGQMQRTVFMMGDEGKRPPPGREGLARDRCPSCGGKLVFEPGREQGFCPIEGLYVEVIVPPPPDADRPPLVRAQVLQATKRELVQLGKAYGLRVSGNKTDVLTRLLRYMDDHGIDLSPEEMEEKAGETAAATGTASGEAGPGEPAPPPAKAAPPPRPPPHGDIDILLAEVAHLAAQPGAEPPPEMAGAEVPAVAEAPATKEETPGEEAVSAEPEAPSVEAVEPVVEGPAEETVEEEAFPIEAAEAPAVDTARLRRDRAVFYVGTLLIAVGGPGLLVGSILHDAMRVPLFGDAFEAFGSLNVTAAILGAVLLVGGIVAMGVGLRGGIVRPDARGEG